MGTLPNKNIVRGTHEGQEPYTKWTSQMFAHPIFPYSERLKIFLLDLLFVEPG
jgi:hypothetical protein